MRNAVRLGAVLVIGAFLAASVADARGGGGRGGRGGWGGGGPPPSGGGAGTGSTGPGQSGGRNSPNKPGMGGKNASNAQALAELEDRKTLIAERRRRLIDGDREANQEARLAAARLDAASFRTGADVR
jgi:hypothetical protein